MMFCQARAQLILHYNNHEFYKLLFGAIATFFLSLIQASTVSDKIWLPPPHTITAGMTQGYSPFIVRSIKSTSAVSRVVVASSLVQPCRFRVEEYCVANEFECLVGVWMWCKDSWLVQCWQHRIPCQLSHLAHRYLDWQLVGLHTLPSNILVAAAAFGAHGGKGPTSTR